MDFLNELQKKLLGPLPGPKVQQELAARSASGRLRTSRPKSTTKEAAVLVMFYPKKSDWLFPLIQRPNYVGTHSGQVAFPGGKWEPEDTSLGETALRETQEELGVDSNSIDLLGPITPLYIEASDFMVHPFVGACKQAIPYFDSDPFEVGEVLATPLDAFLKAPIKEIEMALGGQNFAVPYFDLHHRIVWGATAMMLNELKTILLR